MPGRCFRHSSIKNGKWESLDGRWYLVRMVPYRTTGDMIDGVVLTFTDITTAKLAAHQTREAQLYAESIVDTVREPLLVLDSELRVVTAIRWFSPGCSGSNRPMWSGIRLTGSSGAD